MNAYLTDPQQPPRAPAASQSDLEDQAQQFIAAINEVYATPTSYRDPTPTPAVGTTPPVAQPGRPPMSQKATDASALMLSAGVASLPLGLAITGILWASGNADPVVTGLICAAPPTLVFALSRLVKGAKEATPPVHHHHYNGTVNQDQRSISSKTSGFVSHTRNQLPR